MQDHVVMLCASPQMKNSTSMKLLELLEMQQKNTMDTNIIEVGKSMIHKQQVKEYEQMAKASAIVIAFPLYVYSLPGMLIEFLVGYKEYLEKNKKIEKQKIYAIINCGFPESYINEDAAHVIRMFCNEIHAEYCFSVLIGGGGFLRPMHSLPVIQKVWDQIKEAFKQISDDILIGNKIEQDIHIDAKMPKILFRIIGNMNFYLLAKKNGLRRKDRFYQPYGKENHL